MKRQQQNAIFRGSAELRNESGIHLRCTCANRGSRLQSLGRRPAAHVQRKILEVFVVIKPAPLPSGSRPRLDHKQRSSSAVARSIFQQGAQNFLLRRPRMNRGDCVQQIRGTISRRDFSARTGRAP